MSMSAPERVRHVMLNEPVDYIPTQINYTPDMGNLLAVHLGCEVSELRERLGNHLLRVDIDYEKPLSDDGKTYYDWWGAGWSTETEGYWLAEAPMHENKDLDAYPWPDPTAPGLLATATAQIKEFKGKAFIVPNFGFALYERAWSFRDYEQFNLDMALEPEWTEEVLERITVIQVELIKRYIELGVDGGYFGDDYGAQKSLLFSPRMWRNLIKPRLARMFAPFKDAGLPVMMHSDGDIGVILPDLVEIGLNAVNPVQPEVLDHVWVRKTFGNNLAYYGGISTQETMPSGSPAEVRKAAEACVRDLAPDGTGLLLGPSHRMQSDIPMDNVSAMLDYFAELRGA